MGQVGVRGMVLNGIKAGFDRSLGGGAEFIYDSVNILDREGVRGLQLVGLVEEFLGNKAAVPKLNAGLAAVGVDRLGHLAQLGNMLVLVQAQVKIGVNLRADCHQLNNIQAAAACGACGMVCNQIIADKVFVFYHLGVHAGQQNTVFQFQSAKLDRAKQGIITHSYTIFLKINFITRHPLGGKGRKAASYSASNLGRYSRKPL